MIKVDAIYPENMDRRKAYKMTSSTSMFRMRDLDGVFTPVAAVFFTDEREDGTSTNILSLEMDDGSVYATNSSTFIRAFGDILSYFGDIQQVGTLQVIHSTSKSGRPYITCDIV